MNMIKPLLSNKELYTMTYPQKWVFLSICDTFHIPTPLLKIVLVFYLLNSMNLKNLINAVLKYLDLPHWQIILSFIFTYRAPYWSICMYNIYSHKCSAQKLISCKNFINYIKDSLNLI